MEDCLHIIKGSVKSVVSKAQFERLYKPNGWVIDEDFVEKRDEAEETVKELKTETEKLNYLKMKKVKSKKFNDKLFYSDEKE